ncbi:TRAP transporter large permease [Pyramidobacter sp. YE332]|uniref:TRAP transporter large permease n=2 Tax=unclassified Pyramidobacter TaxID=2632171 RepID=UPI00098F41C9|nr:TRAP transporter large permease [Pyramidobacter sp. YE332]OON89603.1 C4-dicarboxylate ABC transporter permease [Pyramidobacter sp. C12-8]RKJ77172.1 TRAP transporter large permease [Pyramidobacter sp. CG50-2]WOL40403.1 TRAP transporter large permease [Pyramidobacter sp. YE332]
MLLAVFGTMFLALLLTIPIAATIGLSCIAFTPWVPGGLAKVMFFVGQRMVVTADSFTLLALPFFILAGTLMSHGGIARQLTNLAEAVSGDFPGGLGISAVVACTFFAAVSGSGPATVAAIGAIMLPTMLERGYDVGFSGGLIACAGGIGVLIPPSVPMIVYGVNCNVSITDLFVAGIVPGIIVAVFLIIPTIIIARKHHFVGKPRGGNWLWVLEKIWQAKTALLMPIIILGGIYCGIFTPTEAGIVAVVYAMVLGFCTRQLSFQGLIKALVEAAVITGSCIFLMGAASAFAKLLHMRSVPTLISNLILGITSSKVIILLLLNVLFLLGGMFIDTLSNILIFCPIFLPLVTKLGVNPIHFGVLVISNLALGMATPPMGVDLFVAANIAHAPFERILKGAIPFMLWNLTGVLLITYVPFLSLWPF